MAVPLITELPTPPSRQDPANFSARGDAFLGALPQFRTEINNLGDFVESRASYANSQAVSAQQSASLSNQSKLDAELAAEAAQSFSNFKGEWSSLSGQLSVPASVLHNGQVWVLITNLADVSLSEPGVSSDWIVSGGIDASETSDFQAARNSRYWIGSNLTITLPYSPTMPKGTFVEISKSSQIAPIIQSQGGVLIKVGSFTDTQIIYNINSRIVLIFNGTEWEI